jgi:lipooligosaccharide transport system permease protein
MHQAADSLVVKAQRLTKRFGDRVAVKAITLLITPMFIFSGLFYPVETLPEVAQVLVSVLPLSHAIALVRPLVSGQPLVAFWPHVTVLLAYAVGGYLAATIFIRRRLI